MTQWGYPPVKTPGSPVSPPLATAWLEVGRPSLRCAPGPRRDGGTALDPEVISQLLRKPDPGLAALTPREREVLGLMAEGRSNSGIAGQLVLTEGAIEKHIASILSKLALEPEAADNRRVLAVLRYLRA